MNQCVFKHLRISIRNYTSHVMNEFFMVVINFKK